MKESFYFSNMCPQHPQLNRRGWKNLEEKIRDWAIADSAVIVICGPIMERESKTNEDETLEDINGEIDRIRHLPIERLTKSVVSAYFNRIFYSEINNIYQPSASAAIDAVIGNKTISIIFSNNNCTELRQQVNILSEAVYLDNPFVLDSLNTILIRTDETERNTIKKLQRKSVKKRF